MTINGRMSISFPETFSPLDQNARENMHFYGREPAVCLQDKDLHMIVIISYQDLPLISRIMLNDREVVSSMERSCAQAMKSYEYRLIEFMNRQIGGKTGYGFHYTYSVEGVPMAGECCSVRDGKLMYNLYAYYREQLREDSAAAWETIVESVKWIGT